MGAQPVAPFLGWMNIHLPPILMFTRQGFDPQPNKSEARNPFQLATLSRVETKLMVFGVIPCLIPCISGTSQVLFPIGDHQEEGVPLSPESVHTVDGRNPCRTTLKPLPVGIFRGIIIPGFRRFPPAPYGEHFGSILQPPSFRVLVF